VKRSLLLIALIWAGVSPSFAQAGKPVTYEGIEVKQTLNTGTGQRVSTVFLKLANSNAEAVEVRNIRCEFYDGAKLAKQFSIPRLMVQPGSDKYEAPEKVEGPFNRPVCKLGK
jgi:hypothetical protein